MGSFVKTSLQAHQKVTIKNDVWIGANSVVMPGVTVGNGAVIGASAVVTSDVPDYAVVAGVPAKIIKYRFSEDIVNILLDLRWWDLKPEIIKDNIHLWQNFEHEQGGVNMLIIDELKEICLEENYD